MNVQRPIPLRPDPTAVARENHRSLMRGLFAFCLGRVQNRSPEVIAHEGWENDINTSLVVRAVVTPISTATSGLPMLAGARLLPTLLPKGAGSRVIDAAGMKLDFARGNQFYLPYLGTLPGPIWVGETGAFPVVSGMTGGLTFGPPSKLGFMLKFTNELKNYAIEDGYTLFSRMMTETIDPALDAALFSSAAPTSKSQAGLLYGTSALTPTAGGGLNALVADFKQLAGAMAASGVSSDGAIIVTHTEQAEVLNLLPPQPVKHEVLGTPFVAVGTVILLQPAGLITGYDGDASIFMSPDASAHMESANPATDLSGASPVSGSFQTDSQLLKMVLRCAWAMRPGAVQWLSGCTW